MKVHVIGGPAAGKVLDGINGNELSFPVREDVNVAPALNTFERRQKTTYVRHRIHRLQFEGMPFHFSADANLSAFDAFNLLWREYESHCISKTEG